MSSANPAQRVHQAFTRIHAEHMAGLPLLNDALAVEVVGFVAWGGRQIGVLITPWCVNLMVLPQAGGAWQPPDEGVWRHERFPGMELQLLGGAEQALGRYAFRSLLSPVTGYADQQSLRAVAREVLKQLLGDGAAPVAEPPAPAVPAVSTPAAAKVSRRQLLGGR